MNSENKLQFGVFLSTIEEPCQNRVWDGVEAFCREKGIDVTAYISIFQQKTGKLEEHYKIIFDAIRGRSDLDGIIYFSGFIAEEIGTKALTDFMESVKGLPGVSIAAAYEGMSSFLTDNEKGMHSMIEHLITEGGCRDIAFVKGPEDHGEAEDRFRGYCRALEDHDIPLRGELVIPGSQFSFEDGEDAAEELLRRGVHFDAVASVDDDTAMGVLSKLEERSIAVPDEVLVGGFDNSERSRNATPSLTTLDQPFFQLGYRAAEGLLNECVDRSVQGERKTLITPRLMKRESTGCIDIPRQQQEIPHSTYKSFSTYVQTEGERILKAREYAPLPKKRWLEKITDHLTARTGFARKRFVHDVNTMLIHSYKKGADLAVWRDILSLLIRGAALHGKDINTTIPDLCCVQSRILEIINRITIRAERNKTTQMVYRQWELRGFVEDIVTSFDYHSLTKSLLDVKDEMDLPRIEIYLYQTQVHYERWKIPEQVNKVIQIDSKGVREYDIEEKFISFNKIGMYQDTGDAASINLYMPIFFDKEQNGILMLGYNREVPIETYESLRMGISTAIKGASLIKEVEEISITDELTRLYNRRGFLTLSYSRLARLKRTGTSAGLLFIDMDGLKMINDNLGHKRGDQAISDCADILKGAVRGEDIIGRIGGDEFTIFAAQVDEQSIRYIVDRIRRKFTEYNKAHPENAFTLGCSIGYSLLSNYTEAAFNTVLSKADSLLYEEKRRKKQKGISRK